MRADEVDVQRVGQRVDEAADEEERRELGEEGRRELLLDGDDEAASSATGIAPTCVESKFYGAFASSSTPSTRRLLDGVAMPVPRRSTEPGRAWSAA